MKKISIVLGLSVFFTSNLYALQSTTNKTISQETIKVSDLDYQNSLAQRENLEQGRKESINHDPDDSELDGDKTTDVDYEKFLYQHNTFNKESDNTLPKDQVEIIN